MKMGGYLRLKLHVRNFVTENLRKNKDFANLVEGRQALKTKGEPSWSMPESYYKLIQKLKQLLKN